MWYERPEVGLEHQRFRFRLCDGRCLRKDARSLQVAAVVRRPSSRSSLTAFNSASNARASGPKRLVCTVKIKDLAVSRLPFCSSSCSASPMHGFGLKRFPRSDLAHADQAEDRVAVVLDQPLAAPVVFLHRVLRRGFDRLLRAFRSRAGPSLASHPLAGASTW